MDFCQVPVHDLEREVFLAGEVMVERALRDAGRYEQILNPGRVVSTLEEGCEADLEESTLRCVKRFICGQTMRSSHHCGAMAVLTDSSLPGRPRGKTGCTFTICPNPARR